MARPEVTGRKFPEATDAFSIATFCARHGMSVAHYYRMRAEGKTPVEMKVGGRILISKESAQRWRRKRETIKVG
jgi:hypothetical protein